MAPGALQIEELAHHLALGPMLARWHVEEWGHLYETWDLPAATAEFAGMDRPGRIPTTWVAFAGGGRSPDDVAGSVTLAATDDLAGFEHLHPWLVSLYVRPEHRRAGVAAALVARLLHTAGALGHDAVHLFTTGQERYYLERGWRTVARPTVRGEAAAVMVRRTDRHAARRSVASGWCADPHVRGAYAHLRRGGTPADRDAVGGEVHPGLHLAGEAGSRRFPGTMHGAWWSGQAAADAVLAAGGGAGRSAVVVGAGLAGLAAARRLHDAGTAVTLVEPAGVVGGRARTDRSIGVPLHLGAAWLHGNAGHPLAALGAAGKISDWPAVATFGVGRGLVAVAALRRADAELHRRLERESAAERRRPGAGAEERSYGETGLALIAAMAAEDPTIDDDGADVLRTWLRGEVSSLYAAPMADLSLAHGAEPYELPGDDVLLTTPLDELLAPVAAPLDVRLGTCARSVARQGDGRWRVTVAPAHGIGIGIGVGIGDASGIGDATGEDTTGGATWPDPPGAPRALVADAVVVTVPIGVLQAGGLTFDPPLPERVHGALGRMAAGAVAKVAFTFDEAFWAPHPAFWITAPEPVRFALWVDVSGLAGVPALCAFAVGDDARWAEAASEDERCLTADALLRGAGVIPGPVAPS